MTSGLAHKDWLIRYIDHNDYDSGGAAVSNQHCNQLWVNCCSR